MHKCCLLWLLCNCCMVIYGESDTQFSPGDERHRKKFVEAVLKSDASDDPNLENQLKERHDLKYNGLPKPQIVKHFKNSFYPSGTPKKFFDTLNRKRVSGNKGNNIQIERGSSLQRISDVLRMIKLDYQKWPLEEMTVREKELVKKDKNNNDFRYDVKGKPNSELFQPKAIHLTHNSIKNLSCLSAKQNIRPYNRSAGSDRHQSNKPNSYRRLPLDREKRNTTNLKQTRYNENIAQLKGRKFDQDPKSTMLLNNLKSRLRQSELVKIVENQKKENELLKKRHLQNLAKIDDILNTEINQSNDINRSGDKSSELISLEKCIDTLNFNPVDGKIGHALVEPFIVSNITSEGTSKIYKLTPRSSNSNTSYIILPVPKFSEDGSTNQFNYFINEILTDIRRISKRAAEYSPGLLRGKILRNNNEQYSSNLNVSLDAENSWQNHWNKTANEIYRHSENPNLLNKFTCIHEADQNIDSARGSNKRKEDVNTGCEHSRKESKRNVHIKEVNNMHQYLDFDSKNKLPFDKPISHGKNNEDESDISHWHWNENGHKTDDDEMEQSSDTTNCQKVIHKVHIRETVKELNKKENSQKYWKKPIIPLKLTKNNAGISETQDETNAENYHPNLTIYKNFTQEKPKGFGYTPKMVKPNVTNSSKYFTNFIKLISAINRTMGNNFKNQLTLMPNWEPSNSMLQTANTASTYTPLEETNLRHHLMRGQLTSRVNGMTKPKIINERIKPTISYITCPGKKPLEMKLIKPTISYLVCPSEKPLEAKQIKPTTSYVMSPSEKPTEAKEIKPTVSYVVCPSEKSLEAKQIKPAVSNVARPSEKPSGSKQTSPTVSYIVRPSEKPLEAKQIKPTVGYVVCPSERSLEAKEIKPTQGYDVRPSEKPLEIKQTKPTVSYAMHPSEKPLNTPCLCPCRNLANKTQLANSRNSDFPNEIIQGGSGGDKGKDKNNFSSPEQRQPIAQLKIKISPHSETHANTNHRIQQHLPNFTFYPLLPNGDIPKSILNKILNHKPQSLESSQRVFPSKSCSNGDIKNDLFRTSLKHDLSHWNIKNLRKIRHGYFSKKLSTGLNKQKTLTNSDIIRRNSHQTKMFLFGSKNSNKLKYYNLNHNYSPNDQDTNNKIFKYRDEIKNFHHIVDNKDCIIQQNSDKSFLKRTAVDRGFGRVTYLTGSAPLNQQSWSRPEGSVQSSHPRRNIISKYNNLRSESDFESQFVSPPKLATSFVDRLSKVENDYKQKRREYTREMVDAKKQSKSMYNQSYKKGFSTRNALKQSNRYLRKINPLHAKSVEKTTCSASTEYAEGAEESTEEIVSSKQEVALSTEAPKSAASTTEVSSKTETTEYHGTEGNKLEQTSEAFKPEPEQENLKPEQGPTTVQNKPEPRPEPEGHKPETEPEPLPSGQGGSEGVGQGEATTPPGHPTQTQGEHDEFGGIGNTQDKGVGPSGGQGKGGGNVGTLSEAPSTQQAPGGNETEPMPETDRASTTPPNELLDLSCKLIHSDPSKSVETVQLKCFQGKKKTVGRHASRHPKRRRNAVRLHGQKFRVGRAIAREHDPHVTTNQKDNEHLRKTISIEIQKKPNELKTQYKKHRKRFGPSEAKKQYDKGTPKGPKRHERFNHFGFDRIIGCSQMTKKTPVHYENYFRPKNTRPYYYE